MKNKWMNRMPTLYVGLCLFVAGCAHIQSFNPDEAIQGIWKSDHSVAVYEISKADGRMTVRGYSSYSGREMQIGDVSWDGAVLKFTSYMPSTDFRVDHENRLTDATTMVSETRGAATNSVVWTKEPSP